MFVSGGRVNYQLEPAGEGGHHVVRVRAGHGLVQRLHHLGSLAGGHGLDDDAGERDAQVAIVNPVVAAVPRVAAATVVPGDVDEQSARVVLAAHQIGRRHHGLRGRTHVHRVVQVVARRHLSIQHGLLVDAPRLGWQPHVLKRTAAASRLVGIHVQLFHQLGERICVEGAANGHAAVPAGARLAHAAVTRRDGDAPPAAAAAGRANVARRRPLPRHALAVVLVGGHAVLAGATLMTMARARVVRPPLRVTAGRVSHGSENLLHTVIVGGVYTKAAALE